MRLLDQVVVTEKDIAVTSGELAGVRQQASIEDQGNLNLRKEIEYQDRLVNEQKEISHSHYKELSRLREYQMNLDKELDQQHKKVQILRTEIENNEQRCNNIQDVLMNKEENIARTHAKLGEATSCIQDLKYQLNKLDGELGYFES